MRIVGVHGVRQLGYADNPDELADIWHSALTTHASVDRDELTLAYYSPLLDLNTPQGDGFLDDLSGHQIRVLENWLTAVGVPTAVAQGQGSKWLRDGVSWLIETGVIRGVSARAIALVFREVLTYVDIENREPRLHVRRRVADVVKATRPEVVIAHSLGSVVAYETFWEDPSLSVELLVTIGSPLALPGVFREELEPAPAKSLRRPPGVKRWVNIADVGDFIAIPRSLQRYFADVDEDHSIDLGFFEFHHVAPYLRSASMAATLSQIEPSP